MPEMPSFKLNALRRSKGHSDAGLGAATTHFSKMVIKFNTNKIEQCELTPIVKEEEEICKQDYSGIVEREKHTNIASDQ